MGNVPNLIDIDSYCVELSEITGLNKETITSIVLLNFSKIYATSNKNLDFTDATEGIESDIFAALNKINEDNIVQMSL